MFLVASIVFCVIIGGVRGNEACEAGCKCCHKEIRDTVKSLASMVKAAEPMVAEKQAICDIVEIRGISSLCYNEKSCFKEVGPGANGPCYTQALELTFTEITVGCVMQDPAHALGEMTKNAAKKTMEAAKGFLGKLGSFGKRSADKPQSQFILNASWCDVIIDIEMSLCFDDDIFNITKLDVTDKQLGGLKIWCEGSEAFGKVCGAFTGADAIKSTIGMLVKMFAKNGLSQALENPMLKDELLLMNCNDLA